MFFYVHRSKCRCQSRALSQKREKEVFRCRLCTSFHSLRYCSKFLRMEPEERDRVVRKFHYCVNCLAQSHTFLRCDSKNTCRKCKNHHHTLLHRQHPRVKAPSAHNCELQPYRKKPRVTRNPKKQPTRNPPKAMKQPKAATTPDPQILSEAIRSLASVLCVTHTTAQVHGRRHV